MKRDWKDNQRVVVFAALMTLAILMFVGSVIGMLLQ